MSTSKLDLEVSRGTGFSDSKFAFKFSIKNYDTGSIPLSALRVVSYAWLQNIVPNSAFTSGVTSAGTIETITTSAVHMPGNGTGGIVYLNTADIVYTVNHLEIDPKIVSPQISLNVPYGSSSIGPIAVINRTATSFQLSLPDVVPTQGYQIAWFLPDIVETYTDPISVSSPVASIETITSASIINFSKRANSRFLVGWNSTDVLNPSKVLNETDVYFSPINELFPTNKIVDWYSYPNNSILTDDPYFVLEQYVSGEWVVVSEYSSSSKIDDASGQTPSLQNTTIIKQNALSGTNSFVYIDETSVNPFISNTLESEKIAFSETDGVYLVNTGSSSTSALKTINVIKYDSPTVDTYTCATHLGGNFSHYFYTSGTAFVHEQGSNSIYNLFTRCYTKTRVTSLTATNEDNLPRYCLETSTGEIYIIPYSGRIRKYDENTNTLTDLAYVNYGGRLFEGNNGTLYMVPDVPSFASYIHKFDPQASLGSQLTALYDCETYSTTSFQTNDGKIYVIDNTNKLYEFDTDTETLILKLTITNIGIAIIDSVCDESDVIYLISDNSSSKYIYTLDISSGVATPISYTNSSEYGSGTSDYTQLNIDTKGRLIVKCDQIGQFLYLDKTNQKLQYLMVDTPGTLKKTWFFSTKNNDYISESGKISIIGEEKDCFILISLTSLPWPGGYIVSVSREVNGRFYFVLDMDGSSSQFYYCYIKFPNHLAQNLEFNIVYATSDYNRIFVSNTNRFYTWNGVSGGYLYEIDINTWDLRQISTFYNYPFSNAFTSNDGTIYFAGADWATYNETTSAGTYIGIPGNNCVYGFEDVNGKIYAIGNNQYWKLFDKTTKTWAQLNYTPLTTKKAFEFTYTKNTNTASVEFGSPYINLLLKSEPNKTRSLIKLDDSKIPSEAKRIKKAILRIGVNSLKNEQYFANGNVSVHKILSTWDRGYATWTKRTLTEDWSSSGGDYSSTSATWLGNTTINTDFSITNDTRRFIMDFDVTSFVEEWLTDPTSNNGFLIKLSPDAKEELTDVEYEIQTARSEVNDFLPELIINYSTSDVGNTPYVEIVNPEEETTVYSSITLRATAEVYESTIEKVEYYYSSSTEFDQSTLLGEALFTGTGYVYTVTTDELDGDYYIFAKAQSVLGAEGTSLPVLIHFEKVTPVTVSTNGVICHNGSLTIDGTYETLNGNNPILIIVQYKYKQLNDASSIFRFITEPDNPNVIWCSTMGSGIIRINTSAVEEDAVTFYNKTNNGLYSDYTTGISLDSDGWLWFGSRQAAADQSGVYGITKLNTNAWDSLSDDDIVKYDLSSISNKDVWDIDIYGTKKIFTFTFGTTMSSTTSDLSDISAVYSSITQPRSSKIFSDGSIIIGTASNKLYHISGTDVKSFTTPLSNIRSVEKDIHGYVWAATTNGALKLDLTTSAFSVFNKSNGSSSATYPYGLNKNSDGVGNNEYMSVVVSAPNGDVVFGMPEFGSYHGGIARYNGTSWYIYDTDNTPGLPSNNIGNTIEFDSNNRLWASTSKGLTYYDGSWHNLATEEISLSATINSDGTWSVDWTNPTFKNPHQLKVVYTYPDLTDKVYFDVTPSRIPEISATYSNPVVGIIHDTTQKIANVKITCDDIMYGGSVSYSVEKSSDNVSWNIIKTDSYKGVFDYSTSALQFEKSYYRFSAENQSGCSALSNSVLVYGNTAPTGTLSATSEIYNSKTDLEVFGECYDVDSGTFLSNDGYSIVEGVSAIHLYGKTSASDSYIGVGTIDNNSWSYTWDNPVVGTSAIKAVIYDYLGATKEYIYTLDSIIKGVGSIKLIAPTNIDGYYKHTSATTFIASAVDPEYTISSIEFWSIPKYGTSALNVGVGTSIGNNLWTKTALISSFTSAIDCSGGTYKNFAKMTNSNGDVIFSDIKEIYLNHIPDVVINVPDAIHTGTQTISGSVIHPDGSVSIPVYITSGNTIVKTTTADSAGKFYWTITNPEYGIKNYSVVVNDTETSATGDSRKRNFVLKSSTKPVFHITSHTVNSLNVDTGTIIVSGEIG